MTNCSEPNCGPRFFRRINLIRTFKTSLDPNYVFAFWNFLIP